MSEVSDLVDDVCDDAPADVPEFEPQTELERTPRRGERLLMLPRRMTVPQWLMVVAVVIYVAYFTKRTLDLHHGLGTSTYDSALYDQGIWLLSRFEAPFVTLMGRNLFGDHSSFVLLFLVPFYWVFPAAGTMFFAQAAAIGAGAIPVFLYGRRRLGSEWFALIAGVAYLVHPAVGWTNLENFHPDAFLGVFVGFAIWGALERKWRVYAVFVVLSLLVKEDASLVIVPLGVWVAVRRDRRIGLLTIVGSVAFMLVAMFLVMRNLIGVPTRNGWRIPFGGPRGVIDTAITNPTELAEHLRSDQRPWYLWQMTAPFAWLFLRAPSVALISALVLFTNVLSTFWYQYQIEYHYSLVAVPALSLGTVYAIGAVRSRIWLRVDDPDGRARDVAVPARGILMTVFGLAALVTAYMWAPVPFGRTPLYYGTPDGELAVAAREIMAEIPGDVPVAAHYRLTPHLAYRTEIYQFPTPFRLELYGPDDSLGGTRLGARAERVEYVVLPTTRDEVLTTDWLAVDAAFDVVAENDYWVLYRRDRSVELPPGGTDIEPLDGS
ncbi:MAG: DUF2079 domain-containing protein [Acidimicrobiia bacterium]|nr:DUF2079 domain-containing protein [Acidimicrobiia bacterium]